eukprot:595318-Pyramimonas_sp.AAC.1
MIRDWAKQMEEQSNQGDELRRSRHLADQRGARTRRRDQHEDAPQALQRDRQERDDPRTRAAKRNELLDDLPKCFKKPRDANKTDDFLDIKATSDEMQFAPSLRKVLITGKAAAKERKYDALSNEEKKIMDEDEAIKVEWSKWT